jgi:hypothetical protein
MMPRERGGGGAVDAWSFWPWSAPAVWGPHIELDRLLGMRLKWRNHHAEGKSQDRKTLHRSSPILCTLFVHAVEA